MWPLIVVSFGVGWVLARKAPTTHTSNSPLLLGTAQETGPSSTGTKALGAQQSVWSWWFGRQSNEVKRLKDQQLEEQPTDEQSQSEGGFEGDEEGTIEEDDNYENQEEAAWGGTADDNAGWGEEASEQNPSANDKYLRRLRVSK